MKDEVSEYIEKLAQYIPEFSDYWNSDKACFNFGEKSSLHGVFSDFSRLVINSLQNGTLKNGKEIFSFIELVILSGGAPANAACTCFLENILNCIPDTINPDCFVPFLGRHSAKFCRSWDKFTGVKTQGL